jgi:hypothetical protein
LTFCDRAEHIIYKAFPKRAAFYYNLLVGGDREMNINNNKKDMDIFKSYKEEIVGESIDKC